MAWLFKKKLTWSNSLYILDESRVLSLVICIANNFLFCRLAFHSLSGVFWWTEVLHFKAVKFILSSPRLRAFKKSYLRSIFPSQDVDYSLLYSFIVLSFIFRYLMRLLLCLLELRDRFHCLTYGCLIVLIPFFLCPSSHWSAMSFPSYINFSYI